MHYGVPPVMPPARKRMRWLCDRRRRESRRLCQLSPSAPAACAVEHRVAGAEGAARIVRRIFPGKGIVYPPVPMDNPEQFRPVPGIDVIGLLIERQSRRLVLVDHAAQFARSAAMSPQTAKSPDGDRLALLEPPWPHVLHSHQVTASFSGVTMKSSSCIASSSRSRFAPAFWMAIVISAPPVRVTAPSRSTVKIAGLRK